MHTLTHTNAHIKWLSFKAIFKPEKCNINMRPESTVFAPSHNADLALSACSYVQRSADGQKTLCETDEKIEKIVSNWSKELTRVHLVVWV